MIDAVVTRFGLARMPFGRDLPPSRLHRHRDCGEAAARIAWAVSEKTIAMITGEVGTGKTVAIRSAVADLDPSGHTVIYIGNPATGVRGILAHVVTALGGRPVHGTAALAVQAWTVLAGEAAERGRTPVLVIDEAHMLDHDQLESIRMMTLRRDRDYAGGRQEVPWRPRSRVSGGRHNPRPSRNARSLSGGRYLPVFVVGDEVRARAFSLSLRSAWMYGCVDLGLSCPIQRAMVTGSTPACSRAIAAECLRVWGVTCLSRMGGRAAAAVATCRSTRSWTASEDSRRPVLVGNSGSPGTPGCSRSQVRITAATFAVSGVTRSLRPLPWQRTVGPVPVWTSPRVRPVSSLDRSPVWAARARRAWSRRPCQVPVSGAASRAFVSPAVR